MVSGGLGLGFVDKSNLDRRLGVIFQLCVKYKLVIFYDA